MIVLLMAVYSIIMLTLLPNYTFRYMCVNSRLSVALRRGNLYFTSI